MPTDKREMKENSKKIILVTPMPKDKKLQEIKKYYKCKGCKTVNTILTLGDLTIGCANCGGREGFLEKLGKNGKWQKREVSMEEDKLSRFLISGKL